jgi:hypothetical protein
VCELWVSVHMCDDTWGWAKSLVRLCKNGAALPLWPVPYFWYVRMRFSLILYIDIYLDSRKRKEREMVYVLVSTSTRMEHIVIKVTLFLLGTLHTFFFLTHSWWKMVHSGAGCGSSATIGELWRKFVGSDRCWYKLSTVQYMERCTEHWEMRNVERNRK